MWNSNFSFTFTLFLNSKHYFPNFETFHPSNSHESDSPTLDCIHNFSSITHEKHLIFDRNIFLHDPTWKSQLVDWCSKFQFLVKISPFAHEIGCSSCMTSLWVLETAQLRCAWKVVIKYKTSQNSQVSFRNVSNTSNFRAIFLWLFTFPGHL